jgi:hypothetical protein
MRQQRPCMISYKQWTRAVLVGFRSDRDWMLKYKKLEIYGDNGQWLSAVP